MRGLAARFSSYLCRRRPVNVRSRQYSSSYERFPEEREIEEDAERKFGWLFKLLFVGTATIGGYHIFPYLALVIVQFILADSIESTECRWICKDNMDKTFGDCSIPQEKSNADINEELELSEASCEEDNTRSNSSQSGQKQPDPPQLSWKLIKTNMFLHRNRKNQTIDEIMVCHCKPSYDGRMGCQDECLNRMLNIECVKGTCPCGDFCSNQQFQKRKYSKLKCFPCGKKGFGLQLQEDIPKGT